MTPPSSFRRDASRLVLVGSIAAAVLSALCEPVESYFCSPRAPVVSLSHATSPATHRNQFWRHRPRGHTVHSLSSPPVSRRRVLVHSNAQEATQDFDESSLIGPFDEQVDETFSFDEAVANTETDGEKIEVRQVTTESVVVENGERATETGSFATSPLVVETDTDTDTDASSESTEIDEDRIDEADFVDAPDVRQILRFAIPAIGVWLCAPILSMIDTSAVGLLSGTTQQAALNPAVSVTDYGGLLVAFMYTATTNLVAAAQQSDRSDPSKPLTAWTLKSALGLALLVGVGFGLILSFFAPVLLRTLIGNDSIDPFIFAAAMRYVRIRCLGMPAAVVIGTAQSACLGMKDLKSPLYVLLAAAVINFLGDAIFVRSPSLWIGGAAGAAWATVFSQYAALGMFLQWFRTMPGHARSKIAKRSRIARDGHLWADAPTDSPLSESRRRSGPPSRGFLSGRFSVLDLFRLPDTKAISEFLPYVIPVTTTAIGRISGYLAMSHVASSALGTIDMAAQQILFSFFCCLTPVCDSLNLTAQSFVPPIFSGRKCRARAEALRRTLVSFLGAGGIFGAALVALVAMIPFLGRFFTTDAAVMSQVNTAIPGLALFFALSGVVCVGEGMLLGQRDLKFLGNAYGAYFFVVPAVLLRLKRRALAGLQNVGVGTMWKTFSCYQVVRCAIWLIRMIQLQRRTEEESEKMGDDTATETVWG